MKEIFIINKVIQSQIQKQELKNQFTTLEQEKLDRVQTNVKFSKKLSNLKFQKINKIDYNQLDLLKIKINDIIEEK